MPFQQPVKKAEPSDSKMFFNDFLIRAMQTTHQKFLKTPHDVAAPVLMPRHSDVQPNRTDLTLSKAYQPGFMGPVLLSIPSNTPPQKRKAGNDLESPTTKRIHPINPETVPLMKSTPTPKRLQPYVAVPPVPAEWRTPTARKIVSDMSSDRAPSVTPLTKDDDAWSPGTPLEADDRGWRGSPQRGENPPPSTIHRTGEWDDRSKTRLHFILRSIFHTHLDPLEKFVSFMEDIFEAEDTVPMEGPSDPQDQTQNQHSSSPFRFFSPLTNDWGHPRLHPRVMRKLVKALEQIAKRRLLKRASQLASVDRHLLGRLLKLMQRSVKAGEDLNVFVGPVIPRGDAAGAGVSGKTKGPPAKKSRKGKGKEQNQNQERERSRSKTPMVVDEEESESAANVNWDKLESTLHIALESVLAADGCIALLGSDDLSKQVRYSYVMP
jgi:cohesin loading factor subunit SCC2